MKQLILETISRCMEDKNLIRRSQRGFMKRKSFLTNLLTLWKEVASLVKEETAVDVVYLTPVGLLTLSPTVLLLTS